MSKTATAQRRLLALRPLVGDQYLANMKMVAEELFDKNNPPSIEDCLSGAVVLKLRQLADRIEAEALAGEADVVEGGPGRESEEGCGCRRNSADGTREVTLELDDGSLVPAHISAHDGAPILKARSHRDRSSRREANFSGPYSDPSICRGCGNDCSELLNICDGHHKSAPIDLKISIQILDVYDFLAQRLSPVVAESEVATSDAPAMTVQEGGSSDAAPGVEGVSPASSTPRFVAVGQYVYDRDLHRFSNAIAPIYRARLLNDGSFNPDLFTWEEGA